MSIVLQGSTSGSITLQEPAVAGSTVLSLPATSGTLITTGSSGQSIPKAALPTGSVLQVVSTTKTDTTSTTSSSYSDITGMSVSITPTSASSKVLVMVALQGTGRAGNTGFITKLVRGSTDICVGDASGSRIQATANIINSDNSNMMSIVMTFLDSPATTSSTTYKLQWMCFNGSTVYINRSYNDDNANYIARTASTITVMEIAA